MQLYFAQIHRPVDRNALYSASVSKQVHVVVLVNTCSVMHCILLTNDSSLQLTLVIISGHDVFRSNHIRHTTKRSVLDKEGI